MENGAEKKNPVLRVVLVCGPSGCGKSTYIVDRLLGSAYDVLDLYQYQEHASYPSTYSDTLKLRLSYVLLEHELDQKIRECYFMESGMRTMYESQGIDMPGRESELLVVEGTYLKTARRADLVQNVKNFMKGKDVAFECVAITNDRANLQMERDMFELPTVEEGFDSVEVIEDFDVSSSLERIQEIVGRRKKRDRVKEGGYFEFSGPIEQGDLE